MSCERFFPYGDEEVAYLRSRDKKLGAFMDEVGHIDRPMRENLFEAVVHAIVGQQISSAAQETVWRRISEGLEAVDAEHVATAGIDAIQSFGISNRKAEYIVDFAKKCLDGSFDLEAVSEMDDEEAIEALSALRGIGRWTAEMMLLFSLGRMDILAFDDLAIKRGMCAVYHHRDMPRERFERYRRRFSPYGSVASLYFWEASRRAR